MTEGNVDELKTSILSLDKRRKSLEQEAQVITDELTQSIDGNEPMGVDTPLVDKDGYPRADIDIYRARNLRKRLNEIRFDHDVIMKEIERKMFQQEDEEKKNEMTERSKRKPKPKMDPISGKWVVRNWDGTISGVENGYLRSFDDIKSVTSMKTAQSSMSPVEQATEQMNDVDVDDVIPFAKIEHVMNKSPADLARLKINDLLIKFGTLDHTNHRDLQGLGEVVTSAYMDHSEIFVTVLRKNESGAERLVCLSLKPSVWEGKGLVGCTFSHIRF